MTRESELNANRDLEIASRAPKRSAIARRAARTFNAIDVIAPLLPVFFLLYGIGWLWSATDWTSHFWAAVVTVGAAFALNEILGSR